MKTKLLALALLVGGSSAFAATRFSIGVGIGPGYPAVVAGYRPGPVWVPGYYRPIPRGRVWVPGYWNRRPFYNNYYRPRYDYRYDRRYDGDRYDRRYDGDRYDRYRR